VHQRIADAGADTVAQPPVALVVVATQRDLHAVSASAETSPDLPQALRSLAQRSANFVLRF
jgi:hypothetical protein